MCDWVDVGKRAVALRTSPQLGARPSRHDSTVGAAGWNRDGPKPRPLARRARRTPPRQPQRFTLQDRRIVERNRRVRKPGGIDDVSVLDQSPDGIRHVPDVDVHPGQHPTAAGQNATNSRPDVAADHDLVVAVLLGEPGVLHPEVVLVGVEVRKPVVGRVLPSRPAACTAGWLGALAQCSTRRCRPKNGW